MTAYIKSLNVLVAQQNARFTEQKTQLTNSARDRQTPLEVRVARLLKTIPMELQREGLSLASLQAGLRGRWRGRSHPGEIGTALRKLGFQRRRQWRGKASFQALWFPA